VDNGQVLTDPHWVGGERQGGGTQTGWNKWWSGWSGINEMIAIAQQYADSIDMQPSLLTTDPPSGPSLISSKVPYSLASSMPTPSVSSEVPYSLASSTPHLSVSTYFLVVANGVVDKKTTSITEAKKYLEDNYEWGSHWPPRLVAEVDNGQVLTDPHWVGGERQGGGTQTGWNKWWSGWSGINEMIAIAQQYIDSNNGE